MVTNFDILKSRFNALISSYIAERDIAVEQFNSAITSENFDIERIKKIIERIQITNAKLIEVQEIWFRMSNEVKFSKTSSSENENLNNSSKEEENN